MVTNARRIGRTRHRDERSPDEQAVATVGHILVGSLAFLALYLACINGTWCNENLRALLKHEGFITAMVAAFYLITLLFARVLLIARPYRKSLDARRMAVAQRAKIRPCNQQVVDELLEDAHTRLERSDRILWSWGDQKGAFELISQAESLLIGSLTPAEAKLRLDVILPEIDRYSAASPQAGEARRRLERSLIEACEAMDPEHLGVAPAGNSGGNKDSGTTRQSTIAEDAIRTVHSNALQLLHRLQLDEFARILKWHRKVLWLTVVGLSIAVLLVTVLGNASLLLMGAAGAYVARLGRIIKRADSQPEDASSYWTNLLLGPLLGAIAAYGGILLIELAMQLNLLGSGLESIKFDMSGDVQLTLAVAFLFGISEGLVNRIAQAGESKFLGRADPSEVMPGSSLSTVNGN